jgi:hypothetical protein
MNFQAHSAPPPQIDPLAVAINTAKMFKKLNGRRFLYTIFFLVMKQNSASTDL